jgi:hypothetical protein
MNQITGIHLTNNNLQIKSVGNLLLSPHVNSTVYIGATEEDIQSSTNKKMFIRG